MRASSSSTEPLKGVSKPPAVHTAAGPNAIAGRALSRSPCRIHQARISQSSDHEAQPEELHKPMTRSTFGSTKTSPTESDMLLCSCESTDFDTMMAVMGDERSRERLQSHSHLRRYDSMDSVGNSSDPKARSRAKNRVIVSAVANLSTAYNLAVINYALMLAQRTYPPSTPQVTSSVVSCSLIGAITGQLTFGYIGDAVGRRKGMIFTLLLTIAGALASAILPWGNDSIYPILAACRFVLGLGVGGVYPLSATTAVESSHDEVKKSKIVAAVFSFQGLGQVLAPLLAYLFMRFDVDPAVAWRLLLGVGALPGLFVLREAFATTETCTFRSGRQLDASYHSLLKALRHESLLLGKLFGASMGWFLFDITFYGNVIFTPVILEDTFGYDTNHFQDVALCSLFVAAIGLPGYFVTILAVGRINFRTIQIMGFVVMAGLFAILGFFYDELLKHAAPLLLTLYALTFFFSNFGPNVSTFCLPAEIFPADVRVKLNGIAAASGKIGATVGAAMFGMIEKDAGVTYVLVLSGVVSVLGAVVTYYFIPSKRYHHQ
ncbi:hypothetical protein Poli38472_003642 [Pythium oligandrum]|uniref:Major facilitator superfamily (MFS) profile domain-containing protein n=1 Tax=Pythium oligandrum TaxID=41045 RepID=A0A8K1CNW7_PYTOL|nr:hypothetical protein Poli38472_003642 [Pythium oligandrum]|eukprot:TMW65877.1 hypothetical protein Poli38472_003642 [Pythium oligandrum]